MEQQRQKKIGKKIVAVTNSIVNLAVLFVLLLLFLFGGYALWDSNQIYKAADSSVYSMYKPTYENTISFEELQKTNKDIFGWLTVYGTHIDYPLVQGEKNSTYLNKDIKGNYSVSGSLFLDYRNSPHFTDFNSVIYGHHMDKNVMFGEIEYFANKTVCDEHQDGSLYYDGEEHGIEFFAFLEVDAYDTSVYNIPVQEASSTQYLDNLIKKAKNIREIGVTGDDRIIILSTCTAESTSGRHVLIGRISNETYANAFEYSNNSDNDVNHIFNRFSVMEILARFSGWLWILWILLILLILFLIYSIVSKRKRRKSQEGNEEYEEHEEHEK